ncbi:voltage-gated potassium channel [Polaromonas sp. CG_9.5]|uniref:potassium channel family protein n=1 Tax=Polaromonas sp. CG_9.5 TaxID=3071705 RepID=UPI002E062F65|nr:voltage-gated potassium channel [Polaromonas sp. CG_9.5]
MPFKKSRKKVHIARRGVFYSLILCGVILLLGGVGFWLLDPGVETIADGLWLAFTTAATVGYGDMVPSTHASRMFAVLVVLMGLAVLSLVTASLAAIFVEKDVEEGEERQIEHELMREIRHLREDVQRLRQEIAGHKTVQPVLAAPDADAK